MFSKESALGLLPGRKRHHDTVVVPRVLIAGRQPLHAPDFPLMLLFTPKAGCTSLTKWFLFQVGKLDEALAYGSWIHNYRTEVLVRQPGYSSETRRLLQSHERPVIKLVRNPYDRTVSSFLHTIRGSSRSLRGSGWERVLVREARARAGKDQSGKFRLSFRDFVRHVAAVGPIVDNINGHVAQQYLPNEETFVSRVIKLENFNAEIRQIEAEFGLGAAPLDKLTSSLHHVSSSALSAAKRCAEGGRVAPADMEIGHQRVRRGNLPPYGELYDEETERLIYDSFAADFEKYDYPRKVPAEA